MIDIQLLREDQGGEPEKVRESQRLRGDSVELVDEVMALDAKWRHARGGLDLANKAFNKMSTDVGKLMKEKKIEEGKKLSAASKEKKAEIAQLKIDLENLAAARDAQLSKIGNIVSAKSAPGQVEETDNKVEKTVGDTPRKPYVHHQILEMIDGYESARGVNVAGHRGYFLKGPGVMLNLALINYGIAFLGARGYMPLQPPYLMKKGLMSKTAQLEDFDEALYKVSGTDGGDDNEEKFLIATSEQPISALHAGEWLKEKDLPVKYAGFSTCFRKEAGKHGKETWGVFRVHQFEKIEQFILCEPENSDAMHEEMTSLAESFYESLGISYQRVNICSGHLNNAAALKYDVEAWFPGMGEYKELVSSSNCTDYQSRSLEVRCGAKKQNQREKKYVHMLNATLCATERALSCVIENYQTDEGVAIPTVLQPFMGGMTLIPYSKPCPPDPEVEKAKKKGKNPKK